MAKVDGQIMVDMKWVMAVVFVALIGFIVKDVLGAPTEIKVMNAKVSNMEKNFEMIRTDFKDISKEMKSLNDKVVYCGLPTKGK